MSEVLHAWALAPAAIGTCCLAADRRRVRAPELAASALMLLAMLDSALSGVIAPVYWAAILLVGAMGLAAIRRGRGRTVRTDTGMTLHTTIGIVAMAGILLAMRQADAATTGHAHGMGAAALVAILIGGTVLYTIGSVVAATRAHGWLDRTQYAAMGMSALIMSLGLLG